MWDRVLMDRGIQVGGRYVGYGFLDGGIQVGGKQARGCRTEF